MNNAKCEGKINQNLLNINQMSCGMSAENEDRKGLRP